MEPSFNGTVDLNVGEAAVCSLKQTFANRYYRLSISKMRLMTSYISLLTRLIVPVFMAVYYAIIKNHRILFDGLKRHVVTTVIAFITKGVLYGPSNKIDPLLRTFRVINFRPRPLRWNPETKPVPEPEPEKSVHCEVLYDPGDDRRYMDVIFIHGLKGSLQKTWTQGMWDLKPRDKNGRVLLRKSSSTSAIRQLSTMTDLHRQSSETNLSNSYEDDSGDQILSNNEIGPITNNNNNDTENSFCSENVGRIEDNNIMNICEQDKKIVIEDEASVQPETGDDIILQYETESESRPQKADKRGERKESVSRCWPRDWLPQDCPGVRVIALNYTTDPYLWRPVWISKHSRTSMSERAWEMMDNLIELGVGEKPIVWVGHSKGGLFVKQMLVHACESDDPRYSGICHSSKGILFYSVPHRGSPLANLNLPLLRQSIELTEVQKNSAEVLSLHSKFRSLLDSEKLQVEVRSFIETTLTLMSLVYVRIVSVESADAEIGELYGVPIDHRNICKPRSRNCFLYQELVSLINSVLTNQDAT